jgi:predicted nucleotidyltransferase
MEQALIKQLKDRNDRIIAAIIKKAALVCPDSLALIGIAGSFHSGDIHERSDLDLCIVINDEEGWKIASCFILEEVGHDIYCTRWNKLETMSHYLDPHVTKLMELDIVYCADDAYLERYMTLRKKIKARLNSPFSIEDAKNVQCHLENAMKEYASTMLSENATESKYASAKMLVSIEYVMYLANKSYIKRGIRRIPEEIKAMKILPKNFLQNYHELITARTVEEIKSCSTQLMHTSKAFASELIGRVKARKEITPESIEGTYEEIVSNWRNKMYHAAHTDDAYLALMTMASCQGFYDEFATEYNVDRVRLFEGFQIDDLSRSAELFDAAMQYYRYLYTQVGEPVRSYPSIEAFEKAYLECE